MVSVGLSSHAMSSKQEPQRSKCCMNKKNKKGVLQKL